MADEKKVVKITDYAYEKALHSGQGLCINCERWKDGIDHKAERVFCVDCKDHTVYGVEFAVQQGYAHVVASEPPTKPRPYRPKGDY